MENTEKKYLTSKTAAELLDAKEDTIRKLAAKNPLLIRKCADSHYRGTLKNWEKLLGLIN